MKKSSTKRPEKSKSKVRLNLPILNTFRYYIRVSKRGIINLYRVYIKGTYPTTELWSLDETICNFLVPRLEEFKKGLIGYPCNLKSLKAWENVLDEIIWLFKVYHREGLLGTDPHIPNKKNNDRAKKAWALFQKHFNNLWN